MTHTHLTVLTGASRGLGLALAEQLLAPDRVLLCLSRHTHEALAQQAAAKGAHLEQWVQDLADTDEAAERLARWLSTLHEPELESVTLINNAGVIPTVAPLDQVPAHEVTRALRVGLEAPMRLTGAFVGVTSRWVARGWRGVRKVLNISSGLGRHPMASQASYCAAKAGLDHFSRCVALEAAQQPHGVRIVSLAPGVIDTDMQRHLRQGNPETFPDIDRFAQLHRAGQLSDPARTAEQILKFLDRPDFGDAPVADIRDV